VDEGYTTSSETSSLSDNTVNNHHNVFAAPEGVDIYKLVDGFEGTHRFKPDATWDAQDEKKLVKRVSTALTAKSSGARMLMSKLSSTGSSHFQPVSCSLLSSWTVATSYKLSRMACSVSKKSMFPVLQALIW
jgi:hypothetical protein